MLLSDLSQDPARFGGWDWGVVAAYLALTTLLGARLAGKRATVREFFLGDRKLPWWAISGSIVATEISAVTFIAVPSISYAAGGNLTYLQFGLGAILARILIGIFFVPKYYQKEIYSPYDYMGRRLGARVKTITTLLFFAGGILGQGARVFVTAFVLSRVAGVDLVASIWLIGLFSIGWTLMGGITTVIWTDVIQFGVLLVGALVALGFAVASLDGSVSEAFHIAREAHKLQVFDFRTDLSLRYTFWVGVLAMPFLNLAALGLDQVMAQRMFCCRNARQAGLAIIVSSAGQLMAVIMLFVGLALYAHFRLHPLAPADAAAVRQDITYIFPVFIVRQLPIGVRGLIVAAVFAAAISSLDSALAALAQTSVGAFKKPLARAAKRLRLVQGRAISDIRLSKVMVVVWGLVLCAMATACIAIRSQYENVIDLALSLVGYTYGALLGIFLLAFLPLRRDDAGLYWAVPMAMLAVFGLSVHDSYLTLSALNLKINWPDWVVWTGVAVLLGRGLLEQNKDVRRVSVIVVGAVAILLIHRFQVGTTASGAAYPTAYWSFPVGTIMTFVIGYALGKPQKT